MKILFINVSIRPDAEIKQFPVGLGYVVTSAHKAGFEFDLLDIDIHGYTDQYVEDFLSKNKYDVIAFGTIAETSVPKCIVFADGEPCTAAMVRLIT